VTHEAIGSGPRRGVFNFFLLNYEGMLALLRSGALARADYQQLQFLGLPKPQLCSDNREFFVLVNWLGVLEDLPYFYFQKHIVQKRRQGTTGYRRNLCLLWDSHLNAVYAYTQQL
jgi:hypothetical protein